MPTIKELRNIESNDNAVKVDICLEDGQQAAWVAVNEDTTLSFMNAHGDTLSCMLENGLQVGSRCTIHDAKLDEVPISIPKSHLPSTSKKVGQSVPDYTPSSCQYSTLLSPSISFNGQFTRAEPFKQIKETSLADQPLALAATRKGACPASLKSRHAHKHLLWLKVLFMRSSNDKCRFIFIDNS